MSGLPIFKSVFEETETAIRDRLTERISDEWRKEPGDFMYDAVAPAALEIKQLEANQDTILKNGFALYAKGEYLDLKLSEVGLERTQAVAAKRRILVEADAGVVIPKNYVVSTIVLDTGGNPIEFTVDTDVIFSTASTKALEITCRQEGVIGNVPAGTPFMLVPPIPGIKALTDDVMMIPGADVENDESAWTRYDFKVKHPDTGGNKNDYIRWVEHIDGVGKIKVIPRWAGNGTVKVILVGTDFAPATAAVVNNVQEHLDPLLAAKLEAEAMTVTGTGASIDGGLSYDSGTSVKMVYDAAGCAIKCGFGGVLEALLETENTFKAKVLAAVSDIVGNTDLLQIAVRDRGTLAAVKTTKGGSTDAVITVKASQFAAANTPEVKELLFYWDGLQPIEIVVSRLTEDTATTLWVDRIEFTSLYGQGLGNGKAPGGARVTVKAADPLLINIAATITYSGGAEPAEVKELFKTAVDKYLQSIVFKAGYDVVYARIGSILINTEGVSNYTGLTINGGTVDLPIGAEEVPVLGVVTI